jgi:hypothetical protein
MVLNLSCPAVSHFKNKIEKKEKNECIEKKNHQKSTNDCNSTNDCQKKKKFQGPETFVSVLFLLPQQTCLVVNSLPSK